MDTPELKKLQFDQDGINEFKEIRKWAYWMSVCGFIFIGLIVVFGGTYFIKIMMNYDAAQIASLQVVPLFLLGAVYFLPIYYLFRFSFYSKRAMNTLDNNSLNISLRYLKLHYRFMGILMILILVFYLVTFIILMIKGQVFYPKL